MSYEDEVKLHYRGQVNSVGLSGESTMPDHVVREKEISAILNTLSLLGGNDLRILEIGCGNGTLLHELHNHGYSKVTGIDFLEEFVKLAKSRNLPYEIYEGDVRSLQFEDSHFDVVITERVIINLKNSEHQSKAFSEIQRVLKPDAHFIMLEAFEDAWLNLNEARSEFGLDPIPMAGQNRWFKEGEIKSYTKERFIQKMEVNGSKLPSQNLLSSHYFMSRVVHSVLVETLKGKEVKERNTHFAKFFGGVLAPYGNYAPVQYCCFQKL
jgi:ubiquinone/menaquinone biosynthesis C-methylase UbiE